MPPVPGCVRRSSTTPASGCDEAGIAGLAWLGRRWASRPPRSSHASARIADAADSLAHGVVSHANAIAHEPRRRAGDVLRCRGTRLQHAGAVTPSVPAAAGRATDRWILRPRGRPRAREVVGLDSIGAVVPGDAGRVLVIGSHGGLHGGDPASALPVDARAAFFHDAGVGKDGAGITRLPVLAHAASRPARWTTAARASATRARCGRRACCRTSTRRWRALGVTPGHPRAGGAAAACAGFSRRSGRAARRSRRGAGGAWA